MRRTALAVAVTAAAAFTHAAVAPAAVRAVAIDLRLAYKANESTPVKVLTLRCGTPARGTVLQPAAACRKLVALGPLAFAPTPRGKLACTQVFGGAETALVTGTFFGKPVWTRLSRVDGCANARWLKVAFLFPQPNS